MLVVKEDDSDAPGGPVYTIVPPTGDVTEGSSGHKIEISLNYQPEADVSVTISFDGADIPSQILDFDPTNWSQSQVATFAIPDDAIYTGSRSLSFDAHLSQTMQISTSGTKPIGILNIVDDESEISLVY